MAKPKPSFSVVKPPPAASVADVVDSWVSGDSQPAPLDHEPEANAAAVNATASPPEAIDMVAPADDHSGVGRINIRVGEARKRSFLVWCVQHGRRPGDVIADLIDAHLTGR
jgi:hypothetical protein